VATSLATIGVTGVAAAVTHYRRGAMIWRPLLRLSGGVLVGSMLGSLIVDAIPAGLLALCFVVFLVFAASQFARPARRARSARPVPGIATMSVAGVVIGCVSALLGIGGAVMAVPWLVRSGLTAHQAVGTAAANGLPISIAGAATLVAAGWNEPLLPPYSLGYVNLPAFVGIVAASLVFAPVGARLAHRLPEGTLRRVFAVFLVTMAVLMTFDQGLWSLLSSAA
jgi:hypothetical protein